MVIPPDPGRSTAPVFRKDPMSPDPKRTLPSLSPSAGGTRSVAEPEVLARDIRAVPEPPIARSMPRRADRPWREPDRRVPLAAEPGGSRRRGAPRGGEPVHRRGHAAHRGASGARSTRSCVGGSRRPISRSPTGWTAGSTTREPRPGPSIPSSAAGWTSPDAAEEILLDLNHARRGARVLPDGGVRGQSRPPAARLLGGYQRRRVVHPLPQGPRDRRAAGRDDRADLARRGVGQRLPHRCSTSCWTMPGAPAGCTATSRHQPGRATCWSTSSRTTAFFLDINRTRSRRYLMLDLASHSTSEVRFASADRPEDAVPGRRAAAPRHRVRRDPPRRPLLHRHQRRRAQLPAGLRARDRSGPRQLDPMSALPAGDQARCGRKPSAGHLVVWEREDGLRRCACSTWRAGGEHQVAFPEPVYTVRAHENPEFDTAVFRFSYTSLVTPNSVVDYDLVARTWTVRKQTEVLGGYDPARIPQRAALRHGARRSAGAGLAGLPDAAGAGRRAGPCCSRATGPTATASIPRSPPIS